MTNWTVVILSGGLDSSTLLYHLRHEGHRLKAMSVNYGQRHSRELRAAGEICKMAGIEHRIVDISGLAAIFGQNALTDHVVDVPHGEYSSGTSPQVGRSPRSSMLWHSVPTPASMLRTLTANPNSQRP
jgi:7-cyano-7-deazaguanine synthase